MGCANYKIIAVVEPIVPKKVPISKGDALYDLIFAKIRPSVLKDEVLANTVELQGIIFGDLIDQAGSDGREGFTFPLISYGLDDNNQLIIVSKKYYRYVPSAKQDAVDTVSPDLFVSLASLNTAIIINKIWTRELLAFIGKKVVGFDETTTEHVLNQFFDQLLADGVFVGPKFLLPSKTAYCSGKAAEKAHDIEGICSVLNFNLLRDAVLQVIKNTLMAGIVSDLTHDHEVALEATIESYGVGHYMSGSDGSRGDLEMIKTTDAQVQMTFGVNSSRGFVFVDPKRRQTNARGQIEVDVDYAKWCMYYVVEDYFKYVPQDLVKVDQNQFMQKMASFFSHHPNDSLEKQISLIKPTLDANEKEFLDMIENINARELSFLKAGYRQEFYNNELYIKMLDERISIRSWDIEDAKEYLYLTGIYYKFDLDKRMRENIPLKDDRWQADLNEWIGLISSAQTLDEARSIAAEIEAALARIALSHNAAKGIENVEVYSLSLTNFH